MYKRITRILRNLFNEKYSKLFGRNVRPAFLKRYAVYQASNKFHRGKILCS